MDVWKIVQQALIDAGFDTYAPFTKQGECKDFYVVLRDSGSAQALSYSTEYHYWEVMCYAPKKKYTQLLDYVRKVKSVMAKPPIYPMLMPTGTETPSFYDDSYNAYMISVQYRNNQRNIHL